MECFHVNCSFKCKRNSSKHDNMIHVRTLCFVEKYGIVLQILPRLYDVWDIVAVFSNNQQTYEIM